MRKKSDVPKRRVQQALDGRGSRYPNAVAVQDDCPIDAIVLGTQHLQEVAHVVRNGSQCELALFGTAGQRDDNVRKAADVLDSHVTFGREEIVFRIIQYKSRE